MKPNRMLSMLLMTLLHAHLDAPAAEDGSFRLITFNIHHGEGIDGRVDLDRIASVITDNRADIVALQEVDRGTTRTGQLDMPAELARRTGLTAVFSNNYHVGGGEYGNAFLTRFPILEWTNTHFRQLGPVEQRGMLRVTLAVHGRELVVANTHLDAGRTDEERRHSTAQIPKILQAHEPRPVLLAGDFNAAPDSPVYETLSARFRDAWKERGEGAGFTIPVVHPARRIDYIWISKDAPIEVREIRVLRTDASDHLPVLAVLEHGGPPRNALFPAGGPTEKDHPALHHLIQVTDRIYSGGEPVHPDAFAALARLGVKAVVSVDGAEPRVAEAKRHGLRYVHIPIGYDGISSNAALAFTRLVRDIEGPIYFHCHHGQHRGPAAAAVACIASGAASPDAALDILRRANTGTNYAGLWRDVAAFTPPGPDAILPELVEVARVDSMVAAMARVDRAWDHLKLCRQAGWRTPPNHPDIVPGQEALLLKEALRETGRTLADDRDERFRQWLRESETAAAQLEGDLLGKRFGEADASMDGLSQSCARCHKAYRD